MIIDLDLTSVLKLELHMLSDSISFFPPKNLCATFIQFEMNSQSTFYTHTHTHTHTHIYNLNMLSKGSVKKQVCLGLDGAEINTTVLITQPGHP